ncbi:MAG: DUF177 domain-containing protein [Pseudomonadota bacterium]
MSTDQHIVEITEKKAARLPVPGLIRKGLTHWRLIPGAPWREELQAGLDLSGLRKLRLEVAIDAKEIEIALAGHLGATVTQPCIVSLEPVTTRLQEPVTRRYVADLPEPEGDDVEMPEDDSLEPLGAVIDLAALLSEALALALPLYPRAAGAGMVETGSTQSPLPPPTDDAAKPFAGLKGLRDALKKPRASGD